MKQYELFHHGVKGMKWGIRKKRRNNIKREVQRIVKERENTSIRTLTKDGVKIDIFHEPTPALAKFLAKYSRGVRSNLKNSRNMTISIKGKRVGDLQLYKESKNSMNVVWIGIDPKNRGKGYAQAVMNSVVEHARKSGFKKLTLEVPGISPDARHIYEKIGFKMTGEKIGEDEGVWGGLSCMEMDLTNELYHHGIKGMKWGIRKKYKSHPRKKSNKREEEPQRRRKGLTDKQKKYIKIGVGIAATALVAYGSYRLYKSGKLDGLISKGKAALQGSADGANIGGFSTKPKPKSVEEAIKGLNRYRGTNQSKNCTFTTVASELSFRGLDIEAKGSTGQHVMGGVIENAFKNAKVYDVGNSKFRTKEAITKSLLKRFPEGSRGAISVQWDPKHLKSGQTGIGHAFNWMIEDGKVRFFDSQTGATDVEKYFKATDKTQMMSYARLDNLEINFDGIKDYVMNKKR